MSKISNDTARDSRIGFWAGFKAAFNPAQKPILELRTVYLTLIFCTIIHLNLNAAEPEKNFENLPQQKVVNLEKKSAIKIKTLRGREIIPYIHKIAELRITIFREYPYLYEGEMSYEERYLLMYSRTEDAMLVIAEDNQEVVGAITGLPLTKSMEEIKCLFIEKTIPADRIFYLGEIVLLQEYRNKNIGYMMYQQFEKAVKEMQLYEKIAICEVVRIENDLRKPLGYKPLDNFWNRQGYVKQPDLIAYFSWKEIGATEETKHPMVFWIKDCF